MILNPYFKTVMIINLIICVNGIDVNKKLNRRNMRSDNHNKIFSPTIGFEFETGLKLKESGVKDICKAGKIRITGDMIGDNGEQELELVTDVETLGADDKNIKDLLTEITTIFNNIHRKDTLTYADQDTFSCPNRALTVADVSPDAQVTFSANINKVLDHPGGGIPTIVFEIMKTCQENPGFMPDIVDSVILKLNPTWTQKSPTFKNTYTIYPRYSAKDLALDVANIKKCTTDALLLKYPGLVISARGWYSRLQDPITSDGTKFVLMEHRNPGLLILQDSVSKNTKTVDATTGKVKWTMDMKIEYKINSDHLTPLLKKVRDMNAL